ncbi:MAG: ABC transporter permease [Cryomorphaceae bacterium BACL21 MAG-121220-bin10]|jgi:ABC-2 type transport system permease protein|nr:MAG: ABC transporter permease [Cryomorphaceae bacterium BACL21 MAG-121220-bin10]|tara:strand:- start:24045 stop:25349 length:1305 start_codon:yes stop_codon:yes gene_type:complete
MNHLGLILVREYLNKVRNKSFIIMTFMSPLLMVGVIGLVTYLSNLNNDNERHIKVLDQSGYFGHLFEDQDQITFELLDTIDLEQAKAITESAQDYGLLFIPKVKNIADLSRAIYFYSEDSPSIVVMTQIERIVQQQANTLALNQAGIDAQAIRDLYFDVRPQLETFKGQETSKLGSGLKLIFGGAAGYLLFMFIIIYGNMIMRSVIEEKTSRIIEVIISSVRPIELLLGKIFGTTLAGITQFAVWVILVGVLGTVMSQVLGVEMQTGSQVAMEQGAALAQTNDLPAQILMEIFQLPMTNLVVMFFLFFIGGYLLYASLYAAIGAAVDSETDTQQFMIPIIMPLIIAVYVGVFTVIEDPHGTVSQVFSFIPLTSPVVMLMRIPFGVPLWEQIVSVVLLFTTFIGTVWFAAKIYRVGILMYGKKPSYKELLKWLKY